MKQTWWMALEVSVLLPGCVTVVVQCPCSERVTESATTAPIQAEPHSEVAPPCEPPELQELDAISVDEALIAGREEAAAVFEVDGDVLVAVGYSDREVATGALALWRELVLRIPTNQRPDLVQFEITKSDDPAGATDNSGTGSSTGRFGRVLSFSRSNLTQNQTDPCAPLARRRGTFDWTLVHEFGHLRMYPDGAVNDFISEFGSQSGPGRGYPDDGSPRLDGQWVTSYAERAGGDEDCVESFTTFVTLDELPSGDSIAARKVRWFASRPGYPELRRALRITEPDGSAEPLDPAPLADYPIVVEPAAWMFGAWRGELGDDIAITYDITPEDIVRVRSKAGSELERWSYRNLREVDPLATVDLYEANESFYLHQVSLAGRSFSESFRRKGDELHVDNELLGEFVLTPDD